MSENNKDKTSKSNKKEIRQAAALSYDYSNSDAPKIVALGNGETAEKIIETAKENNIPIYEDKSLAKVLNTFSLGDEIPTELYGIVAEILLFVSEMDRDYGELYDKKRKK